MTSSQGSLDATALSLEAARAALGRHLQTYAWTHFASFTFRCSRGSDAALREFRHWHRWISRTAQRPVAYFVVAEWDTDGSAHLHALVAGTDHLRVADLVRAWKCGLSRVRVFDPTRGGARYVAKNAYTKGEWEISAQEAPKFRDRSDANAA